MPLWYSDTIFYFIRQDLGLYYTLIMSQITTIRAFGDNYVYLWHDESGHAVGVDPGQADPVIEVVTELGLQLTAILLTHHHHDHIGGVATLKQQYRCQVIGPDAHRIATQDRQIVDGDELILLDTPVHVLATPGHTRTSVCYHVLPTQGPGWVFTGDTLFVGGCGRLFEGDAETLWDSLQRLMALPDDTVVYCGHDYTDDNRAFALSVAPEDGRLQKAARMACSHTTMGQERQTNIFLRAPDARTFAELRALKDRF